MPVVIEDRRRKTLLITMRTRPELKQALDARAAKNGRSLTQEIESLLENLLAVEALEGGPQASRALMAAGVWVKKSGLLDNADWKQSARIRAEVASQIKESLGAKRAKAGIMGGHNRKKGEAVGTVPVTLRCSLDLRDRLATAAEDTGRSMTREIEDRLEHSLQVTSIDWDPTLRAMLHVIGAKIGLLIALSDASWVSDEDMWFAVQRVVDETVDSLDDVWVQQDQSNALELGPENK